MKKITTILIAILVLILVILTAWWLTTRTTIPSDSTPSTQVIGVTITPLTITEDNFTGSRPEIQGSSVVVREAHAYVAETVAAFKASADAEVPDLRAQFGNDAPPSHYTLDLTAVYSETKTTESIIIDGYRYTGGANGNSFYKVFTASKSTGALLSIQEIIVPGQENAFISLVQTKLLADRTLSVFPEDVKKLQLDNLKNFSFTSESLIVYFDKYEIGPGALGAIDYAIPLSELQSYIVVTPEGV